MPGAGYVIARRGLILLFSYVMIIIIVAAVMEATGYTQRIYESIVRESVQAEIQALVRAGRQLSPTELEQLRKDLEVYYSKMYGLIDEDGNPIPPYVRMWILVKNALTFNLGRATKESVAQLASRLPPVPVNELIAIVLPRTVVMITVAYIIMAAIALSLAPRIAYRHGGLLDRAIISYFAIFNAIPLWWLAMVLILVLGYQLRIFPTNMRPISTYMMTFWNDPVNNFVQIVYYAALPIITIVIAGLGGWLYSVRAMVLRIVREDYVVVAKAKGLPERDIARKYILRVAISPVLTSVILSLAYSLGGYIITESIFDWPGMGSLYYAALTTGDTPTVIGLFVVTVGVYVIARFILEILYIVLDPRVRAR
ncbi:MAG: ABC transporter permease [Thermosphaera sp.]